MNKNKVESPLILLWQIMHKSAFPLLDGARPYRIQRGLNIWSPFWGVVGWTQMILQDIIRGKQNKTKKTITKINKMTKGVEDANFNNKCEAHHLHIYQW